MTVYSRRDEVPIFPATSVPVWIPIPNLISPAGLTPLLLNSSSAPRILTADSTASRTGTAAAADEKSRQYVVVEVLGIIYIYNSPDRSKVQAAGAGGAASGGEDEPKPPAESQPPAENPDNPPPAENPPDAAAPPAEPPA